MAPFAFLGPMKDDALREFYTTTSTRDIFVLGAMRTIVSQLLFGDGIADTRPLAALNAQYINDAFLRAIASAHGRGRRLYIGSVDLDSQRFLIWNMGLIAKSGSPDAVELFRKVMLASAATPIAFSPVWFDRGSCRHDVATSIKLYCIRHGGCGVAMPRAPSVKWHTRHEQPSIRARCN